MRQQFAGGQILLVSVRPFAAIVIHLKDKITLPENLGQR